MLEQLLTTWRMRPTAMTSGPSTVAAMESASPLAPFRLVLLDALMPGMDGFATATLMKANPVTTMLAESLLRRSASILNRRN
jgi:CheY-like chemotaxis protein